MKSLLLGMTIAVLTCSSTIYAGHGAIAYSPSTARWGTAYGYFLPYEASSAALSNCGVADCEIVVWEENMCAALAVGMNGGYGWGIHNYSSMARSRALNECRLRTGGCDIVAWVCN